ncbi:unnamed protein product [Rotaria sordida]|uniref:Uncharacterized protein n=1 Tax=Rotaria sordida TaxID=392033 RepID=A0A815B8J5_9BILA|nr:unnamed protein product [Rotaria sordida]CAF1545993.1 unnamed protein product [Rotaria sordida]
MDFNTIDLTRAEQATSLLINNEQQEYQSRTLLDKNNGRYAYLPIFPTEYVGPNECLVLANVPVNRLAPHQINRRQYGAYTFDALMLMNKYNYSDEFSLSEQDANELASRLQVGKSIITFNAQQLRSICHTLLVFHESFRRYVLCKSDVALKEPTLNSKQMAIALEFYLQIDVDLFYMKTCSFRGAEPRSKIEGLFCGRDELQARYTLTPCGNLFCLCCHPLNSHKKTQKWSVVDFNSSSMHRFVNGYTTYLNCPATCTTSNIIYAMTCPCGHYDYIDSTAKTLADVMAHHREHGNRIIHEKLTGSPLFRGSQIDPDERENEMANQMRLYQHSARCAGALRSFLDCNPMYWCFIPLPWDEAVTENAANRPKPSTTDPNLDAVIATTAVDNRRVANYLDNVLLPPTSYTFSFRQLKQQRLFFDRFATSSIH